MKSSDSPAAEFDSALNMARQALYRFVSLALADPRTGAWERLAPLREDPLLPEAATLIRRASQASPLESGPGERPIAELDPRPVLERLPTSRQEHNDTYERTFGLLVSSVCPPYETEFISSKFEFQRSNALADINGFYHAFGLSVAESHPERPDHVALELEFMALLLELERRANEDDQQPSERQQICRDAQARFLRDHLAWWTPAFAKLLRQENRDGFYEAVGILLSALVSAECALLEVDVPSRPIQPSPIEHPEACEGCQLNV